MFTVLEVRSNRIPEWTHWATLLIEIGIRFGIRTSYHIPSIPVDRTPGGRTTWAHLRWRDEEAIGVTRA